MGAFSKQPDVPFLIAWHNAPNATSDDCFGSAAEALSYLKVHWQNMLCVVSKTTAKEHSSYAQAVLCLKSFCSKFVSESQVSCCYM